MMISYSQYCEDVILSRAFAANHKGFYIDVGAAHPSLHSVTRHFYLQGWRGINIEPTHEAFRMLRAYRPRDINLNVGVSNEPGTLTFYEVPASLGESSFSAEFSAHLREQGLDVIERTVPVTTLGLICQEHVPQDHPIDFLKVDAEGFEPNVLAGHDWTRWRPRIVLLEGSLPNLDCERVLRSADYQFATCDGVNRYYVPAGEEALIPILGAPVDPGRDNFQPCSDLEPADIFELEAHRLDLRLAELQHREARIRELENLGPLSIRLARGLQRMAQGHPRLASLVKRLARIA